MSAQELVQQMLEKHGRDRYPTVELNALKLAAEIGVLCGEILRHRDRPDGRFRRLKIQKELGDAALTLFALAAKLEMDVEQAMADVVKSETRNFE